MIISGNRRPCRFAQTPPLKQAAKLIELSSARVQVQSIERQRQRCCRLPANDALLFWLLVLSFSLMCFIVFPTNFGNQQNRTPNNEPKIKPSDFAGCSERKFRKFSICFV